MEMVSGTFALCAPFTLISSCTICPTSGCESLRTAVTLGAAARATPPAINKIARLTKKVFVWIDMNSQALPIIIDMAPHLAFIKLHPSLFILHRLQKRFRLFLRHAIGWLRFSELRRFLF